MVFLHTYLNAVIKLNWAKRSLLNLKGTGASWQVAEIKLMGNSPDFYSSSSWNPVIYPVASPCRGASEETLLQQLSFLLLRLHFGMFEGHG